MRALPLLLLVVVGAPVVAVPLLFESEHEDLALAAGAGRVDAVRALLAAGADPNEAQDGRRPIEHAARGGHLEVVALLLAHGAVILEREKVEKRAANLALAGGHMEVLRLLLLAGSEVPDGCPPDLWSFATSSTSAPILFLAAARGNEALAHALVDAGFPPDEPRVSDGMRPLSVAAIEGSLPLVRLLLERGADANAPTPFGRTPLHHAALGGEPDVVRALLTAGADALAVDALGWTPLHLAALCGHVGAVEALVASGSARPSLDARDVFGWTPLMRVVASGDVRAMGALLERTDANAASASGRTALHIAAERGLEGAYERLVAAGADEEARDAFGTTPHEILKSSVLSAADLEPHRAGEPIVRASWYHSDFEDSADMEFVAWDDGVVLFSDLASVFPWTTRETLVIGRISATRARRLSVELEESGLFRHPAYDGLVELHGTTRYVVHRPPDEKERVSNVPFEQDFTDIDWRYEPETNATLGRLWRDAQAILVSARPTLTEPLMDHFVDPRFIGEGSFRGIQWRN